MKNVILIAALLLSYVCTYAQHVISLDTLKGSHSKINHTYKERLDDYLSLRVDFNTDIRSFTFANAAPQKNFEVKPNQDVQLRLTAAYKFLQVAYQFAPSVGSINNNKDKGKSKVSGLDVNLYLGKLNQQFYTRKVSGYYLANSEDFRVELHAIGNYNKYALLPNFSSKQYGSESFYFFNNNKYSSRLSRYQLDLQKESAG